MRLSQTPPTLLSLLFTLLTHTDTARAIPFNLGFMHIEPRQYGNCGVDLQYTCLASEACSTTNNVAFCTTPAAAVVGGYATYTVTYTETDLILRTSTYTSAYAATNWVPPVTAGAASCAPEPAQYSCGAICCASTQSCVTAGHCTAISSLWSYSPAPSVTSTYATGSAPLRPTSGTASTTTATRSASTTVGFLAPATASGSTLPVAQKSTGLSPGAIAGIVIAVIAGIIILLLICFCCIGVKIFEGLLGIFGIGKKKRRSTERIETVERYSRHGSAASRRDTHTGWFGRAKRPSERVTTEKRKSSGLGGLGAVGAGLAGLALILGLKRKGDKKVMVERSDISSSYYTDSYTGTSASSASSDRRTRESRRHH